MVFTATDGPYKDQLMSIKGRDPKKPPEADHWQIISPDGKVWGAPGARLRQVLAAQAQEAEAAPQGAASPEPPSPDLPEAAEPTAPPAEAAPVPHEEPAFRPAPEATELPATPAEAASTTPAEPVALPAGAATASSEEPAPAPVAEAPAAASPVPPALTFAQVPVKLVIQLWPDEGQGRAAWIGADLPDQQPVLTTLTGPDLLDLLKPLAGVLAQLEAEFPSRQAKIAARLAEQRASAAPATRIASTPAKSPAKAGGRAIKTPLTTVPAGATATPKKAEPSPERQALLANLKQADMFAPSATRPTTTHA